MIGEIDDVTSSLTRVCVPGPDLVVTQCWVTVRSWTWKLMTTPQWPIGLGQLSLSRFIGFVGSISKSIPTCLCSPSQISIRVEETKQKNDKFWGLIGNHGHWCSDDGGWTRSAVFTFFYCRQFLAPRLMGHWMWGTWHEKDCATFLAVGVTMGNPCPGKTSTDMNGRKPESHNKQLCQYSVNGPFLWQLWYDISSFAPTPRGMEVHPQSCIKRGAPWISSKFGGCNGSSNAAYIGFMADWTLAPHIASSFCRDNKTTESFTELFGPHEMARQQSWRSKLELQLGLSWTLLAELCVWNDVIMFGYPWAHVWPPDKNMTRQMSRSPSIPWEPTHCQWLDSRRGKGVSERCKRGRRRG